MAPVLVGEVVEFKARTVRRGRTSVTVEVVVDSERLDGAWARVTEAKLTMVAVDESGKPTAVPPLRPFTPDERRRHAAAELRKTMQPDAALYEAKREGRNRVCG